MPFTPLHMGPGLCVKACLQQRFSLIIFGWSQVVMDLQPLVVMLTGEGRLHGLTHTYVGATLLALVSAASGRFLVPVGLRLLRIPGERRIGWPVALASAFIGTWSHVLLDSFMHYDMVPLWPLASANGLAGVLPLSVDQVCILSGALGAVIYAVVAWRHRGGLRF